MYSAFEKLNRIPFIRVLRVGEALPRCVEIVGLKDLRIFGYRRVIRQSQILVRLETVKFAFVISRYLLNLLC